MSGSVVRVWDRGVRFIHWSVAVLVVTDLLNDSGANRWHRYFGYAAGALVLARLAWGIFGSPNARLSAILASARQAFRYVVSAHARAYYATHAGHNPFGALMALALWSLVIITVVTGWMQQLDAFWGDETVQDVHSAVAYTLATCAAVHVCGAIATSIVHRTNLVKAMITGRKTLRQR